MDMIKLHFLWGGCLIWIISVVKLLTGSEAFGLTVKDFRLGVSVAILNGASVAQILKGVGVIIVLKVHNNEAILFFL